MEEVLQGQQNVRLKHCLLKVVCPKATCIRQVGANAMLNVGLYARKIIIRKVRCFQLADVELELYLHDPEASNSKTLMVNRCVNEPWMASTPMSVSQIICK